jgi:hypothetical protein
LLKLKEVIGLNKVVLVAGSVGEVVTKEHVNGDSNHVFADGDVWSPMAEKLKGKPKCVS